MRVLKPGPDVAANEAKLLAAMLNFEHGAVVRSHDGARLDPPHAQYPMVEISPITTQGASFSVHYRATVGVVYYTAGAMIGAPAGAEFRVDDFVKRMSTLLEAAGDAHLRAYRAVAATPATVMRHRGRVTGGHLIVGPRKCYRKPVSDKSNLRSRLLQWVPISEIEAPPHFSIRAAFTWVFMPITAALAIQAFHTMADVNAIMASIFYDGGNLCKHPDASVVELITMADFAANPLPKWLADIHSIKLLSAAPHSGCLLVRPATGAIEYVGQFANLSAGAPPRAVPAAAPWDPDTLHDEGPAPGCYQCISCSVPIGGEAIVIRNAHVAASALHSKWYYTRLNAGARLHRAGDDCKGRLLCMRCWRALDSGACLTEHMGARVELTVVPGSQAGACAKCPGYETLGRILAGRVSRTSVTGAFVVEVEGERFAITGQKMGEFPLITSAGVAALNLAVVPNIRIAEDPS